jgi:ribosomal protein S18 acetylase RimI-like enzyme
MGTIRRATTADHPRLGELAEQVFGIYGNDYGLMIPAYARDVRVITLVNEEDDEVVGFIQVGFIEVPENRRQLVADVLAIAVAPEHQGEGRGTALFRRAFELLRPMQRRHAVIDIQLTVADTNVEAAALFRRLGFVVIDDAYGMYEGGQRAFRMGLGSSSLTEESTAPGYRRHPR